MQHHRQQAPPKGMTVSVKVYYGQSPNNYEIRRFIFKPEQLKPGCGIYQALLDRIRALYNGLNLHDLHLCWKDDDGDYVVFSSDDELRVAINSVTDNTLRIYIREKELPFRNVSQVYRNSSGKVPSSSDKQQHKSRKKHTTCSSNSTGGPAVNHQNHVTSRSKDRTTSNQDPAAGTTANQQHRRHHSPRTVKSADTSDDEDGEFAACNSDDVAAALSKTLVVAGSSTGESVYQTPSAGTAGCVVFRSPPSSPRRTLSSRMGTVQNNASSPNLPNDSGATVSTSAPGGSSTAINHNVITLCSECHGEGRGVWYRCTVCPDFFLCSDCENRGLHDHHIMMRLTFNQQQPTSGGSCSTAATLNDSTRATLYQEYHYHYRR